MRVEVRHRLGAGGIGEISEPVVEAMPCGVPGLCIHPAHGTRGWIITHIESGYLVGWFPDADPEAVLAAALELGELLPGGWVLSAEDICDEITRAEVLDLIGRWGGRLSKES